MAAQYMLTSGASNQSARTPWVAAFDGFGTGEGFFLAARVRSNDMGHGAIEQTIASMFRGASLDTATWNWYLDNDALGIMHFQFNDSDDNTSTPNASGDYTADNSVDNNDTFWVGVSVRFPGTDGFVQWYYGGQAGEPSWVTYGSEITATGFQDLIVDSLNDFVIGLNRYDSGIGDYWWGRIFEVQYFGNDYPNLQPDGSDLLAWFNAQDFALNDGGTDTATGGGGKLWTLTGGSNMILDDAGVAAGGSTWWVSGPPFSIDWTGANPSPPYQAAITIPQTYLTLITGTLYELNTDVFWDDLKDREDDEDGIVYGDLQIRFSAYTVAGVTFAPALLMQATIQFEDTGSQYSVRLTGTNNDVFDVENGILIPTDKVTVIAQNAAGLVEVGVSGLTPSESAALLQIEADLLQIEADVTLLLTGQDLTNDQKSAEHITSKTTGKVILRNVPLMLRWEADAWEDEAKTIPYGTNSNAGIEAVGMLVSVAWS